MRIAFLTAALSGIVFVGCDQHRAPKKQVEVKAPGVEVKADPQEGVKVKTPAVDIETK